MDLAFEQPSRSGADTCRQLAVKFGKALQAIELNEDRPGDRGVVEEARRPEGIGLGGGHGREFLQGRAEAPPAGREMGIKLDWADFYQHVVLDKATVRVRHLAFTPDNPETFRATLEAALTRFREGLSGKG